MTRTDPIDALTALRPDATEPVGDHLRRRVVASHIEATSRRQPRRPRRRWAVVLAGALVLSGGSAAVATGRVQDVFAHAFSTWAEGGWQENGVIGADPLTAERVASQPGPSGLVFSVMAAPTRAADDPDGPVVGACTVAVLETKASAAHAVPSDYVDVSDSGCQPRAQGKEFGTFGGNNAVRAAWTRLLDRDLYVWSNAAGDAVTAEVITTDGRRWPAVSHDGTFYGWFPAPAETGPQPELVGYAADGSLVGRMSIWGR